MSPRPHDPRLSLAAAAAVVVVGLTARPGQAQDEGAPAPYRTLWERTVEDGGPLAGPAVTADAVLLVAGRAVLALSADTGDVLWSWERNPGPAGAPAVGDDLLYHASGLGPAAALVARRVDDGREIWRVFTESSIPNGPTVEGQTVYVGTEDGLLLALDARTGEERWRFEAVAPIEALPAVAGGLVMVSAQNTRSGAVTVHAVRAEDGKEAWRFDAPRALPATAVAASADAAFVGLSDGRIVSLGPGNGNVRWTATPRDVFVPGAVPAVGRSLAISDRLHLYLLDPYTGEERWVFRLADLRALDGGRSNTLTSSPALTGKAALIGDGAGLMSALDLRSGRRIWKSDLGKGPVAAVSLGPDAVYVVSAGPEGGVVALEHDPGGRLISEVSPTVLFPLPALVNYVAAALLVGAVILALFRLVDRLRPQPPVEEEH